MILRKYDNGELGFWCPGCKAPHHVNNGWAFNGNFEKPTFSPSILVTWGGIRKRCHSYVTDGMIRFLDDCTHELKDQTVALDEWPKDF